MDGVANHLDTTRGLGLLKSRQPEPSLLKLDPKLYHHIIVLEGHTVCFLSLRSHLSELRNVRPPVLHHSDDVRGTA